MDVTPVTSTYGADDQSWLGSAHGTSMARTITLDVSKFSSSTHYPNGYLPSGLALGVLTTGGKYAPYDDNKSDGTQALVGFLFTPVAVSSSSSTPQGALYEHGRVIVAKLPVQSGAGSVDANGKADAAGRIIFV